MEGAGHHPVDIAADGRSLASLLYTFVHSFFSPFKSLDVLPLFLLLFSFTEARWEKRTFAQLIYHFVPVQNSFHFFLTIHTTLMDVKDKSWGQAKPLNLVDMFIKKTVRQ
jgi:hypothetical protein